MDDLLALTIIVPIMLVVGVIAWRHPLQQWSEKRLPLLFSSGMAQNLESIALNRPVNHFAINFLLLLGAFTLAQDISGAELSAFLRYAVAVLVALFALTMARRSAAQRTDRSAT